MQGRYRSASNIVIQQMSIWQGGEHAGEEPVAASRADAVQGLSQGPGVGSQVAHLPLKLLSSLHAGSQLHHQLSNHLPPRHPTPCTTGGACASSIMHMYLGRLLGMHPLAPIKSVDSQEAAHVPVNMSCLQL